MSPGLLQSSTLPWNQPLPGNAQGTTELLVSPSGKEKGMWNGGLLIYCAADTKNSFDIWFCYGPSNCSGLFDKHGCIFVELSRPVSCLVIVGIIWAKCSDYINWKDGTWHLPVLVHQGLPPLPNYHCWILAWSCVIYIAFNCQPNNGIEHTILCLEQNLANSYKQLRVVGQLIKTTSTCWSDGGRSLRPGSSNVEI